MKAVEQFVEAVRDHTKVAIAVMVLLTVVAGAGAPMVEQSSSLDQFQTTSDASQKLDYINENFSTGDANTTTAQIIVRDDNVLDKESLLAELTYQRELRSNATVNGTLATDRPTIGISNVIATTAIKREQGAELQATAAELQRLNATVQQERRALEQNRSELQARSDHLNATADRLKGALTTLRRNPDADIRTQFEQVQANSSVELDETDYETFETAAQRLRNASSQDEAESAYRLGTQGVLREEYADLQQQAAALKERAAALQEKGERLQDLAAQLKDQREALEESPTLAEQIDQIESMNESEIDSTVTTVLSEDGGDGGQGGMVFAFMPTDYEPGSTSAEATMLLVTQHTESSSAVEGSAPDAIVDSQLAMQDLARERSGSEEYMVFGGGVIAHEIDTSMTDSLLIVGPLAFVFVLLTLIIAYRDLLDILLGLVGIVAVLVWTFGFMGWFDISFNQLFVAVPVLLIGLSIDYAIHIFMRHREEREAHGELGPRGSMGVALTGVGIALVWVTATTVIGFLSNLTSPVPPIREFGVVSSVGITAALLVFGVLVPALKVEIDEFLEARGFDRRKRAFGTGGGAFSKALSVGSTAAKKSPYLIILGALLISAGGAYGATHVDTSFNQADFLAESPPGWMQDLPEPFAPHAYSAKANLQYVNDHFVREDSQAQILIQGSSSSITDPGALERVQKATDRAANKRVTQTLSNGEPRITTPLSVMRSVAAQNESFNATFTAADTDGDGVPDRNVKGVYDDLYETAPDRAGRVVYRTEDGEYRALRLVISVKGGASGDAITTQMRDVADAVDGGGLEATATGSAILNKIVQDQLLDTVIESLIITMVAVFAFLMLAYRITEGSATLGAVTLMPVLLSVSWILGTMYLLDIPFNVLTGMITSLTVGLGVAYSIHLSERFNQELERTEDLWASMDRAVTGTGGALLGSAATTVGGFGVLAFAILPPLQQFGIITGMTIIYAFLASVLVLPSMLVVWARFVDVDAVDSERDAGDDAEDEGDAAFAEDGFVPATAASVSAGVARRLAAEHVSPGDSVEATVRVAGHDGRVVLHEEARGGSLAVESVTGDHVDAAADDGDLWVVWRDGDDAEVTYSVAVPEDAGDGTTVSLSGTLLTPNGDVDVGEDAVTVVTDLFERLLAEGTVTERDLRNASEQAARGELTRDQLLRIYHAWLGGDDDAPEAEAPAGETDGGRTGE